MFDPLTILAADGSPSRTWPQSVTPNSDYTVWTITMRPNVMFHDGAPCDAAAVAANFTAQKNPPSPVRPSTAVTNIAVTSPARW